MKTAISLLCAIIFNTGVAMANEPIIDKYIETPGVVGSAKFEFIFWDVYFATLYAPNGNFNSDKPFALSLKYLRDFEGSAIAERSVKEMEQQGFADQTKLAEWQKVMLDVFPNVKKGQTIVGVADASGHAHFYLDQRSLGVVADADFTQRFFDIWLNEKTSEPKLREKLLNL